MVKTGGGSIFFIPTAKSDHIQEHFPIEKAKIRDWVNHSFPRDEKTAKNFQDFGISASFEGNLIQDLLPNNTNPESETMVILLPGSREEAYGNLAKILDLFSDFPKDADNQLCLANSIDRKKVQEIFSSHLWVEQGSSWLKDGFCIHLADSFESVAHKAICAVSMAGTASEQLVGLGKPVIGLKGTGPQSNDSRMKDNALLMGEAFLWTQNPSLDLQRVFNDPDYRHMLGKKGKERMGPKGAAKSIAKKIAMQLDFIP